MGLGSAAERLDELSAHHFREVGEKCISHYKQVLDERQKEELEELMNPVDIREFKLQEQAFLSLPEHKFRKYLDDYRTHARKQVDTS